MSAWTSTVACDRCGLTAPADRAVGGCPACRAQGVPVNLRPVFRTGHDPLATQDAGAPGVRRWAASLPVHDPASITHLGEGGTPLVDLPAAARRAGVAGLRLKDESRNPTWSYKDRLAAVAVPVAREQGADTVVVATTGNHGAAVAAFAAAAGLRCVVLTASSASPVMVGQMRAYGARIAALPTSEDRWTVMGEAVRELGWFPVSGFQDPPVGSHPLGVDGYKTIAYELAEQYDAAGEPLPEWVVVPTAYGDGLAGVARGFVELREAGHLTATPRLVAAEPLGALAAGLAAGTADVPPPLPRRPTVALSTGNPMTTYQALHAVRSSGGAAVGGFEDAEILRRQAELSRATGLWVETAAAVAYAAVHRMAADGRIAPHERVAVLGTSSGLKSLAQSSAGDGPLDVVEPRLSQLLRVVGGDTAG